LLAIGCGGSESAAASFTGTVRGQTFAPKEALSTNATVVTSAGSGDVAAVVITSEANTCASASANQQVKGSQYLVMLIGQIDIVTGKIVPPSGPGEFTATYAGGPIPPSLKAAVVFAETTDATCKDQASTEAAATAGTVRLTAVGNGTYSGVFNLTLTEADGSGNPVKNGSIDNVSGTFTSTSCPGLAPLLTLTRAGVTCM